MHILGDLAEITDFLDTQAKERHPSDAGAAHRFLALGTLLRALLNMSGRSPDGIYVNDSATKSTIFYEDGKMRPFWSEAHGDWVMDTLPLTEEPVGPH